MPYYNRDPKGNHNFDICSPSGCQVLLARVSGFRSKVLRVESGGFSGGFLRWIVLGLLLFRDSGPVR